MRAINKIIIHCADTKPSMDIGVKEIKVWHVQERGWRDIGYHLVIRKDGTVETGRPVDQKGSHCRGYNDDSIGICLVGGHGGIDDRTEAQKSSLIAEVSRLQDEYPGCTVHGHNEFSSYKTCPNFNVSEEFGD